MSLRDDHAVRVSERRDRGDVHDPRGPGRLCRVEDATSGGDVCLLHLAPSLRADADLVDRRTVYERIAAADLADRAAWYGDGAGDEHAPDTSEHAGPRWIPNERR